MSEIKVMNDDEIRDFCIKKDLKIFELEQEIERLEYLNEQVVEECQKLDDEVLRLHSIIKEVREKIENTKFAFDFDREINKFAFDLTYMKEGQELLEILDKEKV